MKLEKSVEEMKSQYPDMFTGELGEFAELCFRLGYQQSLVEQTENRITGAPSGCAILTETQQFDVLNALRKLTEACESVECPDTEKTVLRKRKHARRVLNQLEHND